MPGREAIFELSLIGAEPMLDLMAGVPLRPMDEDEAYAIKSAYVRIVLDDERTPCICCGRWFDGTLPAEIMVVKKFAERDGMLVAGVCWDCSEEPFDEIKERCLSHFREHGIPNAREVPSGRA